MVLFHNLTNGINSVKPEYEQFAVGHLKADKHDPNALNLFCVRGADKVIRRLSYDGNGAFQDLGADYGSQVVSQSTYHNGRNMLFEQSSIYPNRFYFGWLNTSSIQIGNPAIVNVSSGLHTDHNCGFVVPVNATTEILYSGNDGGFGTSTVTWNSNGTFNNAINSFQALNNGLDNQQIYGIATSQTRLDLILMNMQDEYAQLRIKGNPTFPWRAHKEKIIWVVG